MVKKKEEEAGDKKRVDFGIVEMRFFLIKKVYVITKIQEFHDSIYTLFDSQIHN